jgi:hypothetical protein
VSTTATLSAIHEFHDFARNWIPTALREGVWDERDNPVTRMVRAIKAIAPPQNPPVGYAVFSRVYDPEFKAGFEYVRVTLIFERLEQAQNVLESRMKRAGPGDDFVICELREHRNERQS